MSPYPASNDACHQLGHCVGHRVAFGEHDLQAFVAEVTAIVGQEEPGLRPGIERVEDEAQLAQSG
ncbi:hypothetical protein QTH87_20400 [Variovorax sp. J22P168]|nr:hypothetical protein [Variovorax sp. J22P168]